MRWKGQRWFIVDVSKFCVSWIGAERLKDKAVLGLICRSPSLPTMQFHKWMNGTWIIVATRERERERLCTSILKSFFLTCTSFAESLYYQGREAVQSFPAQPLRWAPSGPRPPAVPGRGLDPVQGSGAGGAAETQRPLQQEVTQQARTEPQGTQQWARWKVVRSAGVVIKHKSWALRCSTV